MSGLTFIVLLIISAAWASPPLALAVGVAFGLLVKHPAPAQARKAQKYLLQASVVALGFGMNLEAVLNAGRTGFVSTMVSIGFALGVGALLGRLLGVSRRSSYLISVGTAICGGSAIAAVGPVVGASEEEMSISIGTVFLLNAVGLLVFVPLGHFFALTESQFGLWAALALHDTSSVVGAAAKYGPEALVVATTVKLARALWVVPVTIITASVGARRLSAKSVTWPWFILFFVAAAVFNTYVPGVGSVTPVFASAGRLGLTVTLFLIGTGFSRKSLEQVGVRPLIQGLVLWVIVAAASLALIRGGWLRL